MFARFGAGLALILCFAIATLGVPTVLRAQSGDELVNRLSRLEADLADIQRYVFTGKSKTGAEAGSQTGSGPVVRSTPVQRGLSAPGGTALATDDPANAARIEIRLQQLESQMRNLTGQAEEAAFKLGQFTERLNQVVADMDQRLAALGGTAPTAALPPASSVASATATGAGALKGGKKPGVFGHLTESDLAKINVKTTGVQSGAAGAAGAAGPASEKAADAESGTGQAGTGTAAAPASDTDLLPDGSPQDRYAYAFSYVKRHDYETAEQMLKAFLAAHKDDALAGNAMYWLGETYYVRGNFADAVVTFADGYERYPGSNKAADNLLKLSVSLAKLERPEDACLALSQLREQFPDASVNIKQRAEDEGKRLACTG